MVTEVANVIAGKLFTLGSVFCFFCFFLSLDDSWAIKAHSRDGQTLLPIKSLLRYNLTHNDFILNNWDKREEL